MNKSIIAEIRQETVMLSFAFWFHKLEIGKTVFLLCKNVETHLQAFFGIP